MDRRHRPGIRGVALVTVVAALTACGDTPAGLVPAGAVDLALPWTVATPSSHGLDAAALDAAGDLAARQERMRSLLVVHRGELVFERYFGGADEAYLHDVRSVTKSVVSSLTGIALEEGHIESLDQSLAELLPSGVAELRPEHEGITVRHLLTMSGGFSWNETNGSSYADWRLSGDYLGYLLDREMAGSPGSAFTYNSAAVHLLGVVIEEATGTTLPEYADRVLFGPLGVGSRVWEPMGDGRVNGGAGIDLRARDLARFGQLFLQDGWSGDDRILPRDWTAEASAARFTWTFQFGPMPAITYGYLWWVDTANRAYFAWGYGGQYVYVAPDKDLVVVGTTEWRLLSQEGGPAWLEAAVLDVIVDGIAASVPSS